MIHRPVAEELIERMAALGYRTTRVGEIEISSERGIVCTDWGFEGDVGAPEGILGALWNILDAMSAERCLGHGPIHIRGGCPAGGDGSR